MFPRGNGDNINGTFLMIALMNYFSLFLVYIYIYFTLKEKRKESPIFLNFGYMFAFEWRHFFGVLI